MISVMGYGFQGQGQIEDAGGLKLIYIDPPFDVGADFSMDIEIGDETFHKEPNLLEQIAYRDTWGRGLDSYVAMIYERLARKKACRLFYAVEFSSIPFHDGNLMALGWYFGRRR
jgi:16S rRNA G966 N2-methylase RsmD